MVRIDCAPGPFRLVFHLGLSYLGDLSRQDNPHIQVVRLSGRDVYYFDFLWFINTLSETKPTFVRHRSMIDWQFLSNIFVPGLVSTPPPLSILMSQYPRGSGKLWLLDRIGGMRFHKRSSRETPTRLRHRHLSHNRTVFFTSAGYLAWRDSE
jgi:hypothetical protein